MYLRAIQKPLHVLASSYDQNVRSTRIYKSEKKIRKVNLN